MNTATIEELAYLIKQAREKNTPKPIVFLGAGASKTGGIPLASEIVEDILAKYSDNPRIRNISENEKTYPELMSRLTPYQRNELLKDYIDNAKINVTHIYLAQLMINDYIDYVLTVNFDNLLLRALALYNKFPPTYDMAILKDLTTTTFREKSVVYLHGQHHGLWLLNTEEEMAKVNTTIPPILHSIRNNRVWIFIGYSGYDPIFKHVKNLATRFDNGLYWVTYNNNNPSEIVCKELLDRDNSNTYLIKGYDSDSFMLKLNSELDSLQPQIIDKPFSSLKTILENIVDIDDKEHYHGVKQRLEIAKANVMKAVRQFEEGEIFYDSVGDDIKIDKIKKQIIDIIIENEFNESAIAELDFNASILNNHEINKLLSSLYYAYGNSLSNFAKATDDENCFLKSINKYQAAIRLNSQDVDSYINWGSALSDLARIKSDTDLYRQSIEKYQKAIELNPSEYMAYGNWGGSLASLAKIENDENLYFQSIEKYQKAIGLNPNDFTSYNNWGSALLELAIINKDKFTFQQSVEKYKIASSINSTDAAIYNNWGLALMELAKSTNDEYSYVESFSKYSKSIELNPKDYNTYNNWGSALLSFAKLKNESNLYLQSIEKYRKGLELNPKDPHFFSNYGNALAALAKINNDSSLYLQSLEQYKRSIELNPNLAITYSNWSSTLLNYAKLKPSEEIYSQIFNNMQQAINLGGGHYNLACLHAIKNEKEYALNILARCLQNNEITATYVMYDEDWENFKNDIDFLALLKKYQ